MSLIAPKREAMFILYIYIYTVYIYIANLANLAHQTLYTLCSEI